MGQYISKSALVAEIEKCCNECLKRAKITDSDYWNTKADAYRNVLELRARYAKYLRDMYNKTAPHAVNDITKQRK